MVLVWWEDLFLGLQRGGLIGEWGLFSGCFWYCLLLGCFMGLVIGFLFFCLRQVGSICVGGGFYLLFFFNDVFVQQFRSRVILVQFWYKFVGKSLAVYVLRLFDIRGIVLGEQRVIFCLLVKIYGRKSIVDFIERMVFLFFDFFLIKLCLQSFRDEFRCVQLVGVGLGFFNQLEIGYFRDQLGLGIFRLFGVRFEVVLIFLLFYVYLFTFFFRVYRFFVFLFFIQM